MTADANVVTDIPTTATTNTPTANARRVTFPPSFAEEPVTFRLAETLVHEALRFDLTVRGYPEVRTSVRSAQKGR